MTGERVERRLAAVLAADVAGYSRLMGADEIGTLAALNAIRREIVDPEVAKHKGRIVKTTGDGLLLEFASAVDALTCAMAAQKRMAERTGEGIAALIQFRTRRGDIAPVLSWPSKRDGNANISEICRDCLVQTYFGGDHEQRLLAQTMEPPLAKSHS